MKRGVVYRLTDGNKFYIGSTGLTPEQRLADHKEYSAKPVSQKQPVYRHFTSTNWENVRMETLRQCEYTVKGDLLRHEREEYDKVAGDPNCLNSNRPLITPEERKQQVKETSAKWHEENKDHCKERLQEWRKNNPEKVKAQRKRRVEAAKEEQQEWYRRNKERKAEQVRQWRLANPEKYAEQRKWSIANINEKRRLAREAKNNIETNTNQDAGH